MEAATGTPDGISAPSRILRALLLLFSALALWALRDKPFFWDTIQLGSKHAHWYYGQDFQYLLLPPEIDSGHPPAFGMYLAAIWKLFGKSLAVSHFAMLPFLWGTIWLLFPIGRYFAPGYEWLFPLLALANPVLLTQLLLISPDAVLAFAFLWVLYGILYRRLSPKIIGAMLLAAISTRGMMVVVVLYLFELLRENQPLRFRLLFRKALPYAPSGLLALAYLGYHYAMAGWIGYHPESEWAPAFQRVGISGLLRNTAILGWRLLDFGMVFVWIALLAGLWRIWRKPVSPFYAQLREAVLLLLLTGTLLSLTFLLYTGLHQHRYLLPILLALQLLAFTLIAVSGFRQKWKSALFALMLLGPVSGHFWAYPDHIAQGWDSTLAHLPYYRLKARMIDYLDKQGIPLQQVGTAFPEIGPQYYKDLSGRESGFAPKNLDEQRYILYSNVMNDFTDGERAELRGEWEVVRKLKSGSVEMILYRKP